MKKVKKSRNTQSKNGRIGKSRPDKIPHYLLTSSSSLKVLEPLKVFFFSFFLFSGRNSMRLFTRFFLPWPRYPPSRRRRRRKIYLSPRFYLPPPIALLPILCIRRIEEKEIRLENKIHECGGGRLELGC
jgi:hypothetical protein